MNIAAYSHLYVYYFIQWHDDADDDDVHWL